ncbi:MAG: DEAD/DEAH box helicase [Planctomycetes bacterium]|jgi:superfamily II DNA or RNA helicase|nr:DEAD/DEAH box helicase [Planctomycetota bacterium]
MVAPWLLEHADNVLPRVRARGAELWRAGSVVLRRLEVDRAEVIVRDDAGSTRGEVSSWLEPETTRLSCDCGADEQKGACEHLWAGLLALDAAAAKPVSKPANAPGATAAPGALAAVNRLAAAPAPAAPPPAPEPEPVLPELRYELVANGPGAAAVAVVVRLVWPDGKSPGLGRDQQLPAAWLPRLPKLDQQLLLLRQRDRWQATAVRSATTDADLQTPWPLGGPQLTTVLALLQQTGRTALRTATGLQPLAFDLEPPFAFELARGRAGQGGSSVVHGAFRRGEEKLSLVDTGPVAAAAVALRGDRLVRLECGGAFELVQRLARGGPMVVAAGGLPELLKTLAGKAEHSSCLQPLLAELPSSKPRGLVVLAVPEDQKQPLRVLLQFDYDGVTVDAADPSPVVGDEGALRRRDAAAEAAQSERLLAVGVQAFETAYTAEREQLPTLVTALAEAGFGVQIEGRRLRPFEQATASVQSGLDWFEVRGEVKLEGATVPLPQLLRAKERGGVIELDDGTCAVLPTEWRQRLDGLRGLGEGGAVAAGDDPAAGVRVPKARALLLDALLAVRGDEPVACDRQFAQLRQRLASFTRAEPGVEPAGFRGTLRPYQKQGLGWLLFLRDFGLGGCLADDMGLGKTVQVLSLLATEHLHRPAGRLPSLLVAPRSLIGNWQAEAARFAPGLRVIDWSRTERWRGRGADSLRDVDLLLTTYGTLRVDVARFCELGQRFHYVVLDEANAIKTADSQNSKAVRLLQSEHRLALTGTPVENQLTELWSLFEFLNPGMLGRIGSFKALFGKGGAAPEQRQQVQRALRPVMLRRTKAQVLTDLPPKVEQTLWCEMEPQQRARYDELARHYRERLLAGDTKLEGPQRFAVLQALLRLRQAACHEALIDPSLVDAQSTKLDTLLPMLEELAQEGHKAIVFSQFTTFLDRIEPELQQRGIVFERLDGSTPNRPARVKRFQEDPACAVFLISLKAGGVGINLVQASYVFLLDPWWNPAAEMQAIDRAHRMGQQRTVHAYRLVCKGTVEEQVLELQAKKKALSDAILGGDGALLQELQRSDLEQLLK